ncbi:SCO family protein [Blastococcus saxobsidens]|uniref:SCO family protein n=1 Tax=Blastococcus saxobsidens TaxID=138336 RepID=UPI0002E1B327|nr:SCO family protein [Blastococcus saxobsidens]
MHPSTVDRAGRTVRRRRFGAAAALVALQQVQERTPVVFITLDSERDTPGVMTDWLAHFDSGLATPFVGLTGAPGQVTAVAESVGVSLSPPQVAPDGTVTIQHGVQTLASIDGSAGLVWTSGTTSDDYRAYLQRLVDGA